MEHWEDYDFDLADLKECIYTNIMIAALQLLLIAIAFAFGSTMIVLACSNLSSGTWPPG